LGGSEGVARGFGQGDCGKWLIWVISADEVEGLGERHRAALRGGEAAEVPSTDGVGIGVDDAFSADWAATAYLMGLIVHCLAGFDKECS
jgi:hypothetical protein